MLGIGDQPLSIDDVVSVARDHERVELTASALAKMTASRAIVDQVVESQTPVYGINTGFGEFKQFHIPPSDRERLQRNLVLSHCTGVGERLPEDVVRAMMLLRVNSLSFGYSGIRPLVVQALIDILNADIYPVVPSKGSVGASGDLAPLAHLAIVILGDGFVVVDGEEVPAGPVLEVAQIKPISLAAKEGLALINGTQVMTAIAALVCYDARRLMKIADIAGALSLEALRGTRTAFDPRIAAIRPHQGQLATSVNILKLTEDSQIMASHSDCDEVQDAYSLRCVSQVHGASKDALRRTLEAVDVEVNSVTDNPIVMPETQEIISGGNFHGQPIALVMDYLKVAIAELGDISERRINRLLDGHLSHLPAFLTANPGVNSGLMILQYTAASLVSENKVLCHPASCDSIPTSAEQEDHVSMGTIAARQAREILENVTYVLAAELLAAAQGIDYLALLQAGTGTAAVHRRIRALVPHLDNDRTLSPDIITIRQAIIDGSLIGAAEDATEVLGV